MIPTLGEASEGPPALKLSPHSNARKGSVDNDREDSKIPKSSFSKESTYEKRKGSPPASPAKRSPKHEKDKVKKAGRKVSFDMESNEAKSPPCASIPQDIDEKKNERVVSFNKRVRIRKIRQLEDTPVQEIEKTYYAEHELMEIRNGLRVKIRSLVEQNFQEFEHEDVIEADDDETHFCIRGLEHEFPQGKYRRKQLKMMSRGAVLEEQRLQREFFVHSERSSSTHTASTIDSTSTISSYSMSCYSQEDPSVAIAEIYRIESKPAVQLALEFAKRDEYVADQIYFAHQAI